MRLSWPQRFPPELGGLPFHSPTRSGLFGRSLGRALLSGIFFLPRLLAATGHGPLGCGHFFLSLTQQGGFFSPAVSRKGFGHLKRFFWGGEDLIPSKGAEVFWASCDSPPSGGGIFSRRGGIFFPPYSFSRVWLLKNFHRSLRAFWAGAPFFPTMGFSPPIPPRGARSTQPAGPLRNNITYMRGVLRAKQLSESLFPAASISPPPQIWGVHPTSFWAVKTPFCVKPPPRVCFETTRGGALHLNTHYSGGQADLFLPPQNVPATNTI